jgi:hypothetical protein
MPHKKCYVRGFTQGRYFLADKNHPVSAHVEPARPLENDGREQHEAGGETWMDA